MARSRPGKHVGPGSCPADRSPCGSELEVTPHAVWGAWSLRPAILAPVALVIWLYARGVRRLWQAGARGRGVSPLQVVCFAGGVLALVAALGSPVDAMAQALL